MVMKKDFKRVSKNRPLRSGMKRINLFSSQEKALKEIERRIHDHFRKSEKERTDILSLLLQGPPGSGKTEVTKKVDPRRHMIRIDGSQYSDTRDVDKLIGIPPVAHGKPHSLVDELRLHPYGVIVMEEVEKMHPDVFSILDEALKKGEITDIRGEKASLHNMICTMTTNIGAREATEILKKGPYEGADRDVEKAFQAALKKAPPPFNEDFITRTEKSGGPIVFSFPTTNDLRKIAVYEMKKIGQRLSEKERMDLKGARLEVSDAVIDKLVHDAHQTRGQGARMILAVVSEKFTGPLAKWLMTNRRRLKKDSLKGPIRIAINSLTPFKPECHLLPRGKRQRKYTA
jgi:ATP-dependent Clp protease ATP-binding subunit ClpA